MDEPLTEFLTQEEEKKILSRFKVLLDTFNYISKEFGWDKDNIEINEGTLFIIVVSYFDDIKRCKEYSKIKIADRHKVAGYTIKWISKLKPIQIRKKIGDYSIINNIFALISGLNFLEIKQENYNYITPEYLNHLLYETQYRTISGRNYASKLYLLEKLLNSSIYV